jgi:hypothetical protein
MRILKHGCAGSFGYKCCLLLSCVHCFESTNIILTWGTWLFFLKQVLCWYLSYCWEMFSWLKLLNLQELQCRIKLLRWFVFLFAPVIQYEVNTFDLTRLTRILLDAFFFICKAINWMCGILLSPFHSMHVHLHFQGIYWNIVSYLD